jgi:hypothetical protein
MCNVSLISCQEQVTFNEIMSDDDVHFVLDQHA